MRAMVASAFQGLLRGREVCKADGKAWDASLDLARGDIAAVMEDRIVYRWRLHYEDTFGLGGTERCRESHAA